jgi:hypothetical protein
MTTNSLEDYQDGIPQNAVDTILNLTTTAQELKVGANPIDDRLYIEMQALENGVKWGYSTACIFNLFKNQFFALPAGTNCTIYFKTESGTSSVSIAEKAEF